MLFNHVHIKLFFNRKIQILMLLEIMNMLPKLLKLININNI